jgi:hypothetical protein
MSKKNLFFSKFSNIIGKLWEFEGYSPLQNLFFIFPIAIIKMAKTINKFFILKNYIFYQYGKLKEHNNEYKGIKDILFGKKFLLFRGY